MQKPIYQKITIHILMAMQLPTIIWSSALEIMQITMLIKVTVVLYLFYLLDAKKKTMKKIKMIIAF